MDDDEGAPPAAPVPEAAALEPAPERAALNPRQVRARRRRRRRQLGTLVFVVVAVGVLGAAYLAVAGDDGTSSKEATSTSAAVTTTVAPPFSAKYKTTTGVNVRQGPGTSTSTVATIEQGREVTVACVVQGEVVNAPSGPNPQWLKVTDPGAAGYVSAAFVSTGDDLRANKIPACPAA